MVMSLGEVQAAARAVVDRVEEVVVGKRDVLELVLVGILADGHVLLEDLPGVAKTLIARSFAQATGIPFAAGAVHARPHAVGHHRLVGVRPAHRQLRLPARAGVHQPAARRRDQPGHAEDAGRPARGHAGAPGHRGGPHPPARAALHASSPPRTRSSTRAPTRCPRRSSTGSCCGSRSGTRRPTTRWRCSNGASRGAPRRSRSRPVVDRQRLHRHAGRARGRARLRAGAALHRRRGDRDPAGTAAPGRGRAHAGRWRCSPRRERGQS